MSNLLKLYTVRLKDVKMSTTEELETLLSSDEKTFYFALMYFYLTKKDLKFIIQKSVLLSNMVSLFCIGCKDQQITDYYAHYVYLNESLEQISKIYLELKREELFK